MRFGFYRVRFNIIMFGYCVDFSEVFLSWMRVEIECIVVVIVIVIWGYGDKKIFEWVIFYMLLYS